MTDRIPTNTGNTGGYASNATGSEFESRLNMQSQNMMQFGGRGKNTSNYSGTSPRPTSAGDLSRLRSPSVQAGSSQAVSSSRPAVLPNNPDSIFEPRPASPLLLREGQSGETQRISLDGRPKLGSNNPYNENANPHTQINRSNSNKSNISKVSDSSHRDAVSERTVTPQPDASTTGNEGNAAVAQPPITEGPLQYGRYSLDRDDASDVNAHSQRDDVFEQGRTRGSDTSTLGIGGNDITVPQNPAPLAPAREQNPQTGDNSGREPQTVVLQQPNGRRSSDDSVPGSNPAEGTRPAPGGDGSPPRRDSNSGDGDSVSGSDGGGSRNPPSINATTTPGLRTKIGNSYREHVTAPLMNARFKTADFLKPHKNQTTSLEDIYTKKFNKFSSTLEFKTKDGEKFELTKGDQTAYRIIRELATHSEKPEASAASDSDAASRAGAPPVQENSELKHLFGDIVENNIDLNKIAKVVATNSARGKSELTGDARYAPLMLKDDINKSNLSKTQKKDMGLVDDKGKTTDKGKEYAQKIDGMTKRAYNFLETKFSEIKDPKIQLSFAQDMSGRLNRAVSTRLHANNIIPVPAKEPTTTPDTTPRNSTGETPNSAAPVTAEERPDASATIQTSATDRNAENSNQKQETKVLTKEFTTSNDGAIATNNNFTNNLRTSGNGVINNMRKNPMQTAVGVAVTTALGIVGGVVPALQAQDSAQDAAEREEDAKKRENDTAQANNDLKNDNDELRAKTEQQDKAIQQLQRNVTEAEQATAAAKQQLEYITSQSGTTTPTSGGSSTSGSGTTRTSGTPTSGSGSRTSGGGSAASRYPTTPSSQKPLTGTGGGTSGTPTRTTGTGSGTGSRGTPTSFDYSA